MRKLLPMAGPFLSVVLLAACGNVGPGDAGLNDLPKAGAATCLTSDQIGSAPSLAPADLDGDGTGNNVQYLAGSGRCARVLFARVGGKRQGVKVTGDLPVRLQASRAVAVPGRHGDLVMLVEEHPRGGFQAHLYGYARGRFEELLAHGNPVLPFVATDVSDNPFTAGCTEGGITVTQAVAHQQVGVLPAWDIVRTTYAVDGNAVTPRGSEEVADNVLDAQLHRDHADLVTHSLFAHCLASR